MTCLKKHDENASNMEPWDEIWKQTFSKASSLSFKPDWHLIFEECPYNLQYRAALKKRFYEKRREALKQILRQKDRAIELKEHALGFSKYVESKEGLYWQQSLEGRKETLGSLLSRDNIENLKKDDVIEIVHYSWATGMWSDFPHKATDVLRRNGLPKLRKELEKLLYGADPLDKRFDSFSVNVRGLGAQIISEILAFTFPKECCLWNRNAADASILLGINNLLPYDVWRYHMKLDGKGYLRCCNVLESVKNELRNFNLRQPDFVNVYHFMLFIHDEMKKEPGVIEEIRSYVEQA